MPIGIDGCHRISGIYKISSSINPLKFYIGSAVDLYARKKTHLNRLRSKDHKNPKLQSHYNKYGEDDLLFTIMHTCSKGDLIENEQKFIDELNPWFNICKIAVNTQIEVSRSIETREKIRRANLGKKASKETKQKMRNSALGKSPWNKGLKNPIGVISKISKKSLLCA